MSTKRIKIQKWLSWLTVSIAHVGSPKAAKGVHVSIIPLEPTWTVHSDWWSVALNSVRGHCTWDVLWDYLHCLIMSVAMLSLLKDLITAVESMPKGLEVTERA